jgi:hypothetical protein
MARDKGFRGTNPRLASEIDRWLYEIEHGKPHISIDQRVTGTITVFPDHFRVVESEMFQSTDIIDVDYRMLPAPDDTVEADIDTYDDSTDNDTDSESPI